LFRSIHHKALQGFFALYLNTLAQHRRSVHQLKEPLADHIETFHHLNFKTFCVLQADEGLLSQISHHPWATALKTVTWILWIFPYFGFSNLVSLMGFPGTWESGTGKPPHKWATLLFSAIP
jgi:hypothetical protein